MLGAIELSENMFGKQLDWTYQGTHRVGDHIWWISDVRKFKCHYPNWDLTYDIRDIPNRNIWRKLFAVVPAAG